MENLTKEIETPKACIEFVEDERNIIGWKFKDGFEKYKKAAFGIVGDGSFFKEFGNIFFESDTDYHRCFIEAGVMHWFEPVFEEVKEPTPVEQPERTVDTITDDLRNYYLKNKPPVTSSSDESNFRFEYLLRKLAELHLIIENS